VTAESASEKILKSRFDGVTALGLVVLSISNVGHVLSWPLFALKIAYRMWGYGPNLIQP